MNIAKHKRLLKPLFSLLSVALMGKVLSMLSRLVMVRSIGTTSMSLFSLINPLMILFINLAQLGLPIATSTLVAKKPKDSRKFFVTAYLIGMGLSIVLMLLIFFLAPVFASRALKNDGTRLAIYGLGLLIPLVTTSSIIKGIYIGKGKVQSTTNSSIAEEIFRLLFLVFAIDYFGQKSPELGAFGAVIGMALGEVGQTLYLFFIAPRNVKKNCVGWLFCGKYDSIIAASELLKISLPATSSRLIGSLTYFFEPIIYTQVLSRINIDQAKVLLDYGLLTGYVFPLLLMPGFLTTALSNFFLPEIARSYENNNLAKTKKSFYQLIFASLALGLVFTLIIFFFAEPILYILYHDTSGKEMVRILAFPFLIYYIETPCITTLHALNRSRSALISTIVSSVLRLIALYLLLKKFYIYAVAFSTIFSATIDILLNFINIVCIFKGHNVKSRFKIKGKKDSLRVRVGSLL
ncbi:MAG TPA: hypothetical protein DCY93_00790 [Firmicutes bacterium]|nr:hypothetical protein [Bacillota bacterium]